MATSTKKRLLAVAPSAAAARDELRGLGPDVELIAVTPGQLRGVLPAHDAAWIDAGVEEGAARGLGERVVIGGPGMGSVALAQLVGRIRAEALGPLVRLSVRAPGGRRRRPGVSRRTPFGQDGRVSWALDARSRARLEALAAPLFRVVETVCPGGAERLGVTGLVDADKLRFEAHGRLGGIDLHVEVDEELRGDEAWEVEALCAAGSLLARFDGGRGLLLVSAPLRKSDSIVDERPPNVALALHALAGAPRIGDAATRDRSAVALRAAIDAAPGRLTSRALDIALVHVPRFRNRHDELMLPSLAIARLAAFARGHGFETHVVDLEATSAELDLSLFADDARVDAWIAGAPDEALNGKLDVLWPAIDAAISGRCLVGFSIVDYFGHFQMNLASCLAKRVADRTGQPTVLGGERDQVDGDRALRPGMPFDHVVDGDGEHALLALAQMYAYRDRDARHIRAVWTRVGDAIVKNRIVRSHLDAMPRPSFDGMPLDRYRRGPSRALLDALAADGITLASPPEPSLYLPYAFVKGCVAECTFCSAKEHLDVQAPDKTVDELLALRERYGVSDFVFLNNLVNLGPRWLRRFCERLIEADADLRWTDSCRPTGIDTELAQLMSRAGCRLLNFGAESGSDTVLERMKKGLSRQDIVATLRATHEAGILNRVNLIAGYFHETDADVDQTISLVDELADAIDLIGCFQGFYLFPGMGVDEQREHITLRDGVDRLETGQVTLMYDEVGGLPWEQKRAQINASRDRILAAIEGHGIRTIDKIDEYDLFWLSRTFDDPALTARYVLRVPPPEASRQNQRALLPGGTSGRIG